MSKKTKKFLLKILKKDDFLYPKVQNSQMRRFERPEISHANFNNRKNWVKSLINERKNGRVINNIFNKEVKETLVALGSF